MSPANRELIILQVGLGEQAGETHPEHQPKVGNRRWKAEGRGPRAEDRAETLTQDRAMTRGFFGPQPSAFGPRPVSPLSSNCHTETHLTFEKPLSPPQRGSLFIAKSFAKRRVSPAAQDGVEQQL